MRLYFVAVLCHDCDYDKNLTARPFSDPDLMTKWGNDWLGKINTAKNKLVPFHHHRAKHELSPILKDGFSHSDVP